jgi:hypothetical protein
MAALSALVEHSGVNRADRVHSHGRRGFVTAANVDMATEEAMKNRRQHRADHLDNTGHPAASSFMARAEEPC